MSQQADGGGSTEILCKVCKKGCSTSTDEKAMSCDNCGGWYHMRCEKVPIPLYDLYCEKNMTSFNFYWKCVKCSNKVFEESNLSQRMHKTASLQPGPESLQGPIFEEWNVSKLKKIKLSQLDASRRAVLKSSRPTPALALSQECQSRGKRFICL